MLTGLRFFGIWCNYSDPKYCRAKADRKADGASYCRNAGQYADRLKIFWYMGTFWISHWNFFFKEAEPEWDGTYF